MPILLTVYWFCFGAGLLYVLISGALGMVGHGAHAAGGHDGDLGGAEGVDQADTLDAASHVPDSIEAADIDSDSTDTSAHPDSSGLHGHTGAAQAGHHAGIDYSPFSPLPIAGTICGFGAGGLVAAGQGWPLALSLLGALGGGAVAALLLWLVVGKLLYAMQGSSEAHVEDMLGLEAEVLTPIEGSTTGEIAYILDGTRYTAPARLLDEGRVGLRETVRIRRMKDNIVYVERKRKLLD